MIRLIAIVIWMLIPAIAVAQTSAQEDADKGFLTQLIEENLSDATRDVNIVGFQGALSSQATIAALTVSDADGIWLTLEGMTLDWNRAALLRGAIDINQITADRIVLDRPPKSETSAPKPEASPFSLPDLPVSVVLGRLAVGELVLGSAFFDDELSLTLNGTATLAGGEGSAELIATRLGPKLGRFALSGRYSNETRQLRLMLDLAEDAGGLVASTMGLPDAPSLNLKISGDGPIDTFSAELALATAGQNRLAGHFDLRRDALGAIYDLDVSGDVSPLFAPDYQDFFGNDATLEATVRTATDGTVNVQDFALSAKALTLTGQAEIARDGWPRRLVVQGRVAAPDGGIVLLPARGKKTYVDRLTLDIGYNRAQSDKWSADLNMTGFDRPGLLAQSISINGGGTITNGEGSAFGGVTGDLSYRAKGLKLDDAGLAQAFGTGVTGVIQLQRAENGPTQIKRFTLQGPGVEMLADATIAGPSDRFETRSNILLTAQALERFSILAGRKLSGSGDLAIGSTVAPFDGLFDVIVSGTTQDLTIGVPQLDAAFQGAGTIAAAASRDTNGTRLSGFSIRTQQAQLTANANITSTVATANAALSTTNAGLIDPSLSGPMTLTTDLTRDETRKTTITVRANASEATADVTAELNPTPDGVTTNFDATINAPRLQRFADLLDRQISGSARVRAKGVLLADMARFDTDIDVQTDDLQLGIAQVDPLLAGTGTVTGQISRLAKDMFRVENLKLRTPALELTADAKGGKRGEGRLAAAVTVNGARALNQDLTGPIAIGLDATRGPDDFADVALVATGPKTQINMDATVAPPADDYAINGNFRAEIGNLRVYQSLIGLPLSGQVSMAASGAIFPGLTRFDARVTARTQDLGTGFLIADRLLAGAGEFTASAKLANGSLSVPSLEARTSAVSLSASVEGRNSGGEGQFQARLANANILTDQLNGPITAQGTAGLNSAGDWTIDARASGPGGIGATAVGTYASGGRLDVDVDGVAPLGLANAVLEPRRLSGRALIDLSINGRPSLDAVNGTVTLSAARLAAPTLGQALSQIEGGAQIQDGRATLNVTAQVESGGQVSVNGPVQLTGGFDADLTIRADRIVLRDPLLYETTVSGQMTATGPLQGGARIAGQLDLGATEIQVPSSGIGALGDLPDVTHVGASAAVRQTIARADAGPKPAKGTPQAGPVYPLDITINAPSRIFIRGRGLDAELGGTLRIAGTSAEIVPTGLFELARGRIDILQQRFDLTEGSASLQGDFVPVVRLVATTRTKTGTTVRIIIEGPATEPAVRFESTPDLPQDEVISQLIFGRDLANISPLQAVQLATAVSTLAGRGSGGLVDTFRQNIGFDDLDITTNDDGNAAVRAGKYLTDNVYTDITVSSDGSTDININLDITDEITAKGSVGADGETSIGVFFERDY